MAGIEDYYRNGMRVPPGPSVQIQLGPKAMPSPLDQYFANLRRRELPPMPAVQPVPTTSPATPVEPAVVADEEDDRGPGMWTQRTNPSLTLPSWIKNPSEWLPKWENPSSPRQTAPNMPVYSNDGVTLPGPIPPNMGTWKGPPRQPGYNPLGSANTGLPVRDVGGPTGGQPAEAPPQSLEEMLRQAQIDALTSTANQQGSDYSGLEKAAGDLQNNKWESLMRFGFATAAGESPFFGVNVGQGGIAMLDARDEGLARYNTAMQNIAQLKETQRSNMAGEKLRAIDVAKPNATGSTGTSPILTSYLDSAEKMFEQRRAAILEDPLYAGSPEEMQKALNAIDAERINLYASLGIYAPTVDLDLSD